MGIDQMRPGPGFGIGVCGLEAGHAQAASGLGVLEGFEASLEAPLVPLGIFGRKAFRPGGADVEDIERAVGLTAVEAEGVGNRVHDADVLNRLPEDPASPLNLSKPLGSEGARRRHTEGSQCHFLGHSGVFEGAWPTQSASSLGK